MQQPFVPGVAVEPTSRVEITLSAKNLANKDYFSKSDPFIVTYESEPGVFNWRECHRTEVIRDNLNPQFVRKLVMNYRFEAQQKLRFEIYDQDANSRDLSAHDFLGAAECHLGQLVSAGQLSLNLCSKRGQGDLSNASSASLGSVELVVEELQSSKQTIELTFRGQKLENSRWFSGPNGFLEVYKSTEGGQFVLVHRGDVVKNSANPFWKKFSMRATTLCNADFDRNLKILCYDWHSSGSHVLLGGFYTTAKQLLEGPGMRNTYELMNEETRKRKKAYRNSGQVFLADSKLIERPSFLDFIRGGTELFCTFAIDFTASNGAPKEVSSLHSIMLGRPNQYEVAISAVGDIIRDYDTDKLFPVLGFGARLPPDGRISHEFYVNFQADPHCQDIAGVLQAYKQCIASVQLYGPTNFAPVIQHVASFARRHERGAGYFILLIITDGAITDMPQTKEAIVEASSLPMSIIIVGVGNANFDAMEELDGDDVRVSSRGRYAVRDIVQFVPMRKFLNSLNSSLKNPKILPPIAGLPTEKRSAEMALLSQEVLAEIPAQFLGYMESQGIRPNPPKTGILNIPQDPEVLVGDFEQ